jgi:NDP-sugar pyrophosphorylase family protein
MPGIIESGVPLYGLKIEDPFIDIGTPERYEYAKKWYQEQLGKE